MSSVRTVALTMMARTGGWFHSAGTEEGADGTHTFELSLLLVTTAYTATHAQMMIGETYDFGVTLWDPPNQKEDDWSDANHYVSGCAKEWFHLTFVPLETDVLLLLAVAPTDRAVPSTASKRLASILASAQVCASWPSFKNSSLPFFICIFSFDVTHTL